MGRVKIFHNADIEWIDFILKGRASKRTWHNYAVVIGPTADDGTKVILATYREGGYGKVGSLAARETLIRMLNPKNLSMQVLIASKDGLSILDMSNVEVVKI